MRLNQIKAHNCRNLNNIDLKFSQKFNIFFGKNGSGKTSLLETIHILALSRSFRTHLNQRIINYQADRFSVFGRIEGDSNKQIPIGIEKSNTGDCKIKINGEITKSIAELALLMPIQVINTDSYQLIDSGPKFRRQYIDWGLFHVKHQYMRHWKSYNYAIKQRNAALKQRANVKEIQSWNPILVKDAEVIDQLRFEYVESIKPIIFDVIKKLLNLDDLEINYLPGWEIGKIYSDVLDNAIKRDFIIGYTQNGPHRADLQITVNKIPVQDVLSRGQQKLLISALRLAQGIHLNKQIHKSCIYLIDDLPSELDNERLSYICNVLSDIDSQVFITAIETNELKNIINYEQASMFHVKHGSVTLITEDGRRKTDDES